MSKNKRCNNCKTKDNYYAKGLCRRCYDRYIYLKTKEKKLKQRKEWRKNNPEKVKAMKQGWYKRYTEKILKKVSEYQKTTMGKMVMNRKREKRRAKKKLLNETYTTMDWIKKLDSTKGICPGCGKFVGKNKLELDHIIPISKAPEGFIYTIDDIQPLCKPCNCKKGDKLE